MSYHHRSGDLGVRSSRRGFLTTVAVSLLGVPYLAACGPAPAPTPTPPPAPKPAAAAPTAAPAPKPAAPTPTTAPAPKPTAPAPTAAPAPTPTAPAAAKAPAARQEVTLRIGTWWDVWKPLIEMFTKRHPYIKVSYEPSPFAGYNQKLLTQLAGGGAPDVFMVSHAEFQGVVRKMQFWAIDDLVARDKINLKDFAIDQMEYSGYQGKIYGLSRGMPNPNSWLVYNIPLFDKAGVKLPPKAGEGAWTWDDWRKAGLAITKPPETWGSLSLRGSNIWLTMVLSNGGKLYNDDETKCLLNSPEAIEAFQFQVDAVRTHKIAPTPSEQQLLGSVAFATGKVGMVHTPAAVSWWQFKTNTGDFKVDAWHSPTPYFKKRVVVGQAHPWSTAIHTKVREEAWLWTKLVAVDEEGLDWLTANVVIPAYKPEYFVKKLPDERARRYLLEALSDAKQINWGPEYWGTKAPGEVTSITDSELDKAYLGEKTVKQAADDLVSRINKVLAQA